MTVIWRVELPLVPSLRVEMPAGARVLPFTPSRRDDVIEIWAEVDDTDGPTQPRDFRILGTGAGSLQPTEPTQYVGTMFTHGGAYVWHLYEVVQGP